jgi:hypothetical protein
MKRNFNISPTLSNVYSKYQLKIMQSFYKHQKCFPETYNMSTQK